MVCKNQTEHFAISELLKKKFSKNIRTHLWHGNIFLFWAIFKIGTIQNDLIKTTICLVCFSVHRSVLYGRTVRVGALKILIFHKDFCKKSLTCDGYLKLPKIIMTAFYIKNSIMIIAFVLFRHQWTLIEVLFTIRK